MGIPTRLSEDPTSAALNTKAHALEHCAIDRESLRVLASAVGRQVLITEVGQAARALHRRQAHRRCGPGGARRDGGAGAPREASRASRPPGTLDGDGRDLTSLGGDPNAPVRLTEELLGRRGDRAWPSWRRTGAGSRSAPTIRPGWSTSCSRLKRQAGFGPGSHGDSIPRSALTDAGTSPRRRSPSVRSPGWARSSVRGASRGSFAHAVAFHGQNDSEAIVIGGGLPRDKAHTALKMRLRSRVHDALRAVMDRPPAVVVRRSGPLAGAQQANVVNRVTARGNGIQLEQPAAVRTDEQQREAIARAVAAFYDELI